MTPEQYTLTLKAVRDRRPAAVRMRGLLKMALRCFGWKYLTITPAEPSGEQTPNVTPGVPAGRCSSNPLNDGLIPCRGGELMAQEKFQNFIDAAERL